ncbi:MAG: hypothetical protein MJA31_02045 [Clostridia bacterium]|nr:hypothetical protein [Clostridia bacterium]
MSNINRDIFRNVMQIIHKAKIPRNRPIQFEGDNYFPAEIHLILHIATCEESTKNLTKIGRSLGITKGAVSHIIKKLADKGNLTKEIDTKYKNALQLSFTEKGERLLTLGRTLERKAFKAHEILLTDYTQQQKETVLEYLKKLNRLI